VFAHRARRSSVRSKIDRRPELPGAVNPRLFAVASIGTSFAIQFFRVSDLNVVRVAVPVMRPAVGRRCEVSSLARPSENIEEGFCDA
jgi:hypothetical protein